MLSEQAGRLDDVHLDGFHFPVLDDHVHVAVALDAGDMIDVNRCFRHRMRPHSLPARAGFVWLNISSAWSKSATDTP